VLNINEVPLRERFEAAYKELSPVYLRRVKEARSGTRPYTGSELYRSFYTVAGNYHLCVESLSAYFWPLHNAGISHSPGPNE
jgi:hypothetical protein